MKKKEQSNDLKNLVLVLLVIVILSFSLGVFIKRASTPKLITEYSNGFTFTKVGNSWQTVILNPVLRQEITAEFRYSPSQLKDLEVEGDPNELIEKIVNSQANAAYFTYSPLENISYSALLYADLAVFLKKINGINLVPACTINQTERCTDSPVITCEDNPDVMVIYMKPRNITKISVDKNCLMLQGQGEGLLKAYTKLLFLWYGIL